MAPPATDERRLAFLRALLAAAWSDGELTSTEIRTLTDYLKGFSIRDDELDALRPYLDQPIEGEQARELLREQLDILTSPGERGALVAAVRDLLLSDGTLHPQESRFLDLLDELAGQPQTAQLFTSRLRVLWSLGARKRGERAPLTQVRQDAAEGVLERFFRRRLLEFFRRRIAVARAREDRDGDEILDRDLYRVVIWAGLLSRVAHADDAFAPSERTELLRILRADSELSAADLDVVVDAFADGALEHVNLAAIVSEFVSIAGEQQLSRLLDCLFIVSAADGEITRRELKVIHEIAKDAGFSRQAFEQALQRCKSRMSEGWN